MMGVVAPSWVVVMCWLVVRGGWMCVLVVGVGYW